MTSLAQHTYRFGNATPEDVLLKAELDVLVAGSNGRLKVINVVGTSADQPPMEGWDGALGWVDRPKIENIDHNDSEFNH